MRWPWWWRWDERTVTIRPGESRPGKEEQWRAMDFSVFLIDKSEGGGLDSVGEGGFHLHI
jgi:hypothetical protein